MNKRLLFSLAHPDDESFGSGGVIAKYAKEGADIFYICATDGACGTVEPELLEKYGSIKALRYAELDCAADVLGLKEVFKFDYSDSGMMGSEDNKNPDCLWQADKEIITNKIAEIMRQVQPQVVVTFDPFGAYGHPDHIMMHLTTTSAFHAVSETEDYPQKLYYTTFPRNLLRFFIWSTRLRGQNPRKIGANQDLDLVSALKNSLKVTTKIDIRDYLDEWEAATLCHASQASPRSGIPKWLQALISGKQGLTRAYPVFQPHEKIEKDLFQGI